VCLENWWGEKSLKHGGGKILRDTSWGVLAHLIWTEGGRGKGGSFGVCLKLFVGT